MNRSKLKTYAPQARRDFIQAVTDRAALHGLTPGKIEPITERGDIAIIGGKPFPLSVAEKRWRLEERIKRHGFEQVMEAMAYTWFNRLVAIRYMEIHGYLDHGYRVLSNADATKSSPEIVEHAEHVELPGLDRQKVVDLKLDGTKEAELYRMLLIAQCNALHTAMPFLFERIDDETELLLPDNLLHSDSIIRKLVSEIDEDDWREEVQIIGWLYQFYISEKKDEVIGKVVKSEDIPAATQLFTPNWIVKYLVQNSLGRQWLATYPQSGLRQKMEFYIEPAEQTPEVQAQLKAITPASLNPEELTLMDPASGSGHILVEAYDLLKEIYLERGYRLRDIPKLILTKNLFGLEIDDRAAQLAAFALMMKARADDRRIFDGDAQPNVQAIQESNGLNVNAIVQAFTQKKITGDHDIVAGEFGFMGAVRAPLFATENSATATVDDKLAADLKAVFALSENAKTFGSMIQVPPILAAKLPEIERQVNDMLKQSDLMHAPAHIVQPFLQQARMLARTYDLVVENPPYCGSRYMTPGLAVFGKSDFKEGIADLFAMFVLRSIGFVKPNGYLGVVCPFVWMFIATYEAFRRKLITEGTFQSMVRLEYNAFEPACVPVSTWIFTRNNAHCQTQFIDLSDFTGIDNQPAKTLEAIRNPIVPYRYSADCTDFLRIPKVSFAYQISAEFRNVFSAGNPLSQFADFTGSQNKTGKNSRFVRLWWEPSAQSIGQGKRWVFYSKGGGNRKWWGLLEDVVDWSVEARGFYKHNKTSNLLDERYWFRSGITYSMLTSNQSTFRKLPPGAVYDVGGPAFHPHNDDVGDMLLALCNSPFADRVFDVLNPTLNLQVQDVKNIPVGQVDVTRIAMLSRRCIDLARSNWDSRETSSDFMLLPVLHHKATRLHQSQEAADVEYLRQVLEIKPIEEEINRCFIDAYRLRGELFPEVPDEQISLYRPNRGADIQRLLSYAIGCAMGRYSLDKPGLIYANSGNEGFDPAQYKTFPADKDGIVSVTEIDWFDDAATKRFVEFVGVAWPKEHLEENLKFVADSLGAKNGEQPLDTIRRYLADGFFDDHLKFYQRRPIYWLFTSGKLGAFQCLVYLHRYNEGTLARMRTEYVIPLQGKINARIDQLDGDKDKAASTAHRKRLEKEQDLLKKQQVELQKFDEKLRHYADMRIKLDLDDGVKVNYGKFGDLLACVTQVCGKGEDDE